MNVLDNGIHAAQIMSFGEMDNALDLITVNGAKTMMLTDQYGIGGISQLLPVKDDHNDVLVVFVLLFKIDGRKSFLRYRISKICVLSSVVERSRPVRAFEHHQYGK